MFLAYSTRLVFTQLYSQRSSQICCKLFFHLRNSSIRKFFPFHLMFKDASQRKSDTCTYQNVLGLISQRSVCERSVWNSILRCSSDTKFCIAFHTTQKCLFQNFVFQVERVIPEVNLQISSVFYLRNIESKIFLLSSRRSPFLADFWSIWPIQLNFTSDLRLHHQICAKSYAPLQK